MVKSKSKILGNFELEIMQVVWNKDKATVQEVKDALNEAHPSAYTTLLTMMRRMEKKGLLDHEIYEDGKTYVYKPLISREEVSTIMFHDMYKRLFGNSTEKLLDVLNPLFRNEKLKQEDIQRLRELVAEKEKQNV